MNDKLENAIKRWMAIQRYGTTLTNKAEEEIVIAINKIIKLSGKPSLVLKLTNEILNEAKQKIALDLLNGVDEFAELVAIAEHKRALLVDKNAKLSKISKKGVVNVLTTPIVGTDVTPSKGIIRGFTVAKQQIKMIATEASIQGITKKRFREGIEDAGKTLVKNVETSVRTVANSVSNTVIENQYKGTSINRVMWISTLDHRTSPFCQAADGKVFKINKGPRPPAHFRCRSTVILLAEGETPEAVLRDILPRPSVIPKSDAELKKRGLKTRTGKVRKPRKAKHSPLRGALSKNKTYETWLKSQSTEYQNQILGIKAAKKLRAGKSLIKVLEEKTNSISFKSLKQTLN